MKHRIAILGLTLMSLYITKVNAQTSAIDSLRTLISKESVDSVKLGYYLQMIPMVRMVNADMALEDGQKAIAFASAMKDDHAAKLLRLHNANTVSLKGDVKAALDSMDVLLKSLKDDGYNDIVAGIHMSKSRVFEVLGKHDEGVLEGRKAASGYRSLKDTAKWAHSLNNLGNNYLALNKLDSAQDCYGESLRLAEKMNDRDMQAGAFSNLALVLYRLGDYQKAFDYNFRSCGMYKEEGNLNALANGYMNVAFYCQLVEGKEDSIIPYLHKARELAEQVGNKTFLAACYNALGVQYNTEGKHAEALQIHRKALGMLEEKEGGLQAARILSSIGHDFKSLNDRDSAFCYLDKGMAIAKEIKDTDLQLRLLNSYVVFHRHFREYEKALDFALMKEAMGDSLYHIEKLKAIEDISEKYESEKKEQENRLLKLKVRKRNLTLIGIGVLMSLMFLVVLLLGYAKDRDRKRHRAEVETLQRDIEIFKMKHHQLQGGILTPSADYLDFDAVNAELEQELDELDMAVIRVWFEDFDLTRRETAERLFLSEDGLKDRMKRIRDKIGVSGKEAIVKKIMEMIGVE